MGCKVKNTDWNLEILNFATHLLQCFDCDHVFEIPCSQQNLKISWRLHWIALNFDYLVKPKNFITNSKKLQLFNINLCIEIYKKSCIKSSDGH